MPPPLKPEAAPAAADALGGLSPVASEALPPPGSSGGTPGSADRLALLLRQGAEAQARVASLLRRGRRRARALACTQLLLLLVASALCAAAFAALLGSAASASAARGLAAGILAAGAAGGAAFAVRNPLQRAARSARDPRALAQLLSRPEAGGAAEILSSVELSHAPGDGASRALLSLLHQRAALRAEGVDLRRALPLRALALPAAALATALLAAAALWFLAPHRMHLGLVRLWGGEAALPPEDPSPIAGDLSLTYLYPPYTGLPPRVEQGTAGDLRGPRGTEVRLTARADRDLDKAWAVLDGGLVPLAAEGPGHRALAGTLTLSAPGSWRLRYADAKGRPIAEGPRRPVQIDADQPPQAVIEAPRQLELEVDPQGKVAVSWSASDDYGLSKVSLVYQRAGDKEARVPLGPQLEAGGQVKRLRGTWVFDLAPLGLRAGDKVSYFVEATDNDAVDGPQRGASPTHLLKVFSAAEHHRDAQLRAQQLWERLVGLLADRLEEKPAPPAPEVAAPWYAATAAKDREALELVGELGRLGRALLRDKLAPQAVGRALRYVQGGLSPQVQRTSIARAPLSRGGARPGAVRQFARALGNEIAEEEKDVLYLQDLLDQARMDDLRELSRELGRSRAELARLAEKLRKAPDEGTRKALLAEVQRVRERVQELMQRMAEMARGIRDEHLNREAVEAVQKQQDLLSQLSEVQRKLQSGDVNAALRDLERLSAQLEQVEKGLQQRAQNRSQGQYAEESQKLREAAAEVARLQAREEALQKRTQQLRRETRGEAEKRFAQGGGKERAKKLLDKVAQAKKGLGQIDRQVAQSLALDEPLDSASGRVEELGRALESGDYDEALDQAQRGLRALDSVQARLSMEERFAQRSPAFARDGQGVRKSLQGAARAQQPLAEIAAELRAALPREGQAAATPEQQRELRAQAAEQKSIGEGLQGVRQKLSEVGRKVPVFGPGHEQMLQEAQDGMQRAQEKLGAAEPRGAQAGEAQALDKLSQFQQAMQQMAQQGQAQGGAGMPMPWGEPQGEGEGDQDGEGDAASREHVEIPDAEAGRGPQEFRKELLDAMKQKAPDRYREKVKDYYEELVK